MADSYPGAGFGWDGPRDNDDPMGLPLGDPTDGPMSDPMDDEIHKLVAMVTELGIEAESILFDAVTALLGEGTHGAQLAQEAGIQCENRYQVAHQRGLDLIMSGKATADQARWIVELLQLGLSFRSIGRDSEWIAAQSLELQQPVEDVLDLVGTRIDVLDYLVEQTRLQVRAAILYATSREAKYARSILDDTSDVQRSYLVLETWIQAAIRAHPLDSFPMQQLLLIATRLETIGVTCHEIASAVLFRPPPRRQS